MTRMESTVFPGQLAGGDAEGADGRAARALEEELWRRMSNEGDEDARDELIVSYRPLVFWLAKKFTVRPSSYQDLVQEGMMALIRAVHHIRLLQDQGADDKLPAALGEQGADTCGG